MILATSYLQMQCNLQIKPPEMDQLPPWGINSHRGWSIPYFVEIQFIIWNWNQNPPDSKESH